MYRVIVDFVDRQDNGYLYKAGDEFPRLGVEVKEERIEYLSGCNNPFMRPLIVEDKKEQEATATEAEKPEVEETKEAEPEKEASEDNSTEEKQYTRESIASLNFFSLKKMAKDLGFDVSSMSAQDMRDAVCEKLGL